MFSIRDKKYSKNKLLIEFIERVECNVCQNWAIKEVTLNKLNRYILTAFLQAIHNS